MTTYSSILAWKIPWTEEPGGLHTVHGVTKSQTRLSAPPLSPQHTHPWSFQVLSQDWSSGCLHFPLVFKEKNQGCVNQSGKKFILSGLNGLCSLKIIQAQKGKAYFDRMGKQIEEKAGKHSIEWREKSERKEKTK